MNTLRKYGAKYNVTFCTFAGLSTDTKPVGTTLIDNKSVTLANGSEFIEMDTDKKYLYDTENQQWNLASSGGGGGGSVTLIEKSITENGEYNASDDNADGYSKVTVDVAGGGGGETFEVNATLTGEEIILSKTYEEIKTAILENKKPVLTLVFGDETFICNICTYTGNMIVFLRETVIEEGLISQILVYISPENYHFQNTTWNVVVHAVQAELNE